MPYNYSYNLDLNPKLVPLGSVKYDPVTDECQKRIETEKNLYKTKHRKNLITSIVFFAVSLLLVCAGVILGMRYNSFLLFALIFIALPFLILAVINLVTYTGFKVTGIKECRVTHRETHEYYTDGTYDLPVKRTTDRVTLRIEDTGDEVSVVTDAYTQMHCVIDKKVWLMRTSKGPVISFHE